MVDELSYCPASGMGLRLELVWGDVGECCREFAWCSSLLGENILAVGGVLL
jgi:hypothetical protein